MLREGAGSYVTVLASLNHATACQRGVPGNTTSVFFMLSLLTSRGLLLEICGLREPRDCWAWEDLSST